MTAKMKMIALRVAYCALAVVAYFGGRCPAQGCPACKLVGK